MTLKDCVVVVVLSIFLEFLLIGLNAQEYSEHFRKSQFDITSPIIITDSYSSQYSIFGWSVTLVQSGIGSSAKNWIFIGDPKGESTDPTYKSRTSNINYSGVVWRCSLGTNGMDDTCQILNLDPQVDNTRGSCTYSSCEDFPQYEFKSGSWVGGSLLSNSKRLVTCAPRWSRGNTDNPYMNGLCYWFQIEQMYQTWRPEKNDLQIDLSKFNHRLIPLFEKYGANYQTFALPNNQGSVFDWGLGQFGMSIHLGETQQGMQELVVGAPGTRLYTGSVIIYIDSGQKPLYNSQARRNKYSDTQYSYYSLVNRERQDPRYTPDHYYDYFGYCVTSGKYFGNGETFYVGGSPRARGNGIISGEIVIFKIPQYSWTLEPIQIIKGDEDLFGAYFGSVLLSVDTNEDKYDELFVAAPMCNSQWDRFESNSKVRADVSTATSSSQQPSASIFVVGDQGCVFVYMSSTSSNYERMLERKTQIFGSGSPGGRFGTAMVSLGDINEDSYNDIAISAPYENNGQGAVYIFHGSKDIPLNWIWIERITPQIYSSVQIRSFGSSLSSGQDIDSNGTPDLGIGSFQSKRVIVLRTRPIVKLLGQIGYANSKTNELVNSVPHNVTNFIVHSCVTFTGKRVNETLPLRVTLSLDRNFGRFIITDSVTYENDFIVNQRDCKPFNAQRIKLSNDDASPTAPSIITEQTIEYKGGSFVAKNGQFQQHIITKRNGVVGPVLKTERNLNQNTFCPKCPFPIQIVNRQALEIASECKNPNRCVSKLKVQAYFESNGVRVESITNDGEPAYNPEITFGWINTQLAIPIIQEHSIPDGCKVETNATYYNCTRFDSIKTDKPKEFRIQFTLNEIFGKETSQTLEFFVKVKVGEHSTETHTKLALTSDAFVKISGSNIKTNVPMTERFTQTYTITLEGQTPLETIIVDFKFPTLYKISGSYENVLMIAKPKRNNIECIPKNGEFTQLPKEEKTDVMIEEKPVENVPPMTDSTSVVSSRKRRQVKRNENTKKNLIPFSDELSIPQPNSSLIPLVNSTILTCSSKEADCIQIRCTLTKINQHNELRIPISFEMLMVQENTVKLFGDHDKAQIQSEGSVKILSGTNVGHTAKSISQSIILKFQKVLGVKEIPLWIYFVSGIGGLILLFLITVGLRKTGFFRRKTKEQLEELKAQAEVQNNLQAASNVPNFDNLGDDQRLQ